LSLKHAKIWPSSPKNSRTVKNDLETTRFRHPDDRERALIANNILYVRYIPIL
jgi:hypothetical protein